METTDIKKEILEKTKQMICRFFKNKKIEIYLIGSWARRQEKRTSDIDIGIIQKEFLPEGFLAQIAEEFEQSDIPYRVELVDLTGMDEDKRSSFLRGAIKWKG